MCKNLVNISIGLIIALSFTVSAKEPTEEDFNRWADNWDSLIPPGTYDFIPENVSFDLMFDPTFQKQLDEAGRVLNPSLEGQRIELAGFMVPIETQGQTVSQFLLVPEAGQCIHVPAPPMNQTLLVDASNEPTALRDLYQPIVVSGRLSVGEQTFELADSGYTLIDIRVEDLELDESLIPIAPEADGDR